MAGYTKQMMAMVDNLLSGEWDVNEFRKNYYDYYLEDVPDGILTDKESDFFGGIQEKLDWVDEPLNNESQNNGWLSHKQFLEWVKQQKMIFG